jgi:hypothetical protein
MAKGGNWGRYDYNSPMQFGGFLDSVLRFAASQGKGWSGKGGGSFAGGGPGKGKGKSKGQGKNGMDKGYRDGTDGGRPQWVCDGCDTENRMGRIACRICWAPRPMGVRRDPAEGTMRRNLAVGADGRKPVLGVRGDDWKAATGKGVARTASAAAAAMGTRGGHTAERRRIKRWTRTW